MLATVMQHFMRHPNLIQISFLLGFFSFLTSCDNSKKIADETKSENYKNINKDSLSIWVYDYTKEIPVKNGEINFDTLTPNKLVDYINSNNGQDKIHLDLIKISNDTIYLKIKESTFLTQQMGTTGADEYRSVITFTLTELKGVRYVNLDFEEGDHASPGTYNRQYYIDRNKPK